MLHLVEISTYSLVYAQRHLIIPEFNKEPYFKIYFTVGLDACKISNPFIPLEEHQASQEDTMFLIKDEIEILRN